MDLSTDGSGEWEIVVNRRPDVQWFDQTKYRDIIGSTHLDEALIVRGNNSVAHLDAASGNTNDTSKKWSSLLIPAGAYIQFYDPSRSASTSSAPRSLLIRGSIAKRAALSRDMVEEGWNMALDSSDWTLGSGEWCPTLHKPLLTTLSDRCMSSRLLGRGGNMSSVSVFRLSHRFLNLFLPLCKRVQRTDLLCL